MANNSYDKVTVRKTLAKARSHNDLTAISCSNTSLFDNTMLSLPDTSLHENHDINELRNQIIKIQEELNIANTEIETLNSENYNLKNELGRCKQIIDGYKKVTFEDSIYKTPTPKKRKIIEKKLLTKADLYQTQNNTHTTTEEHMVTDTQENPSQHIDNELLDTNLCKDSLTNDTNTNNKQQAEVDEGDTLESNANTQHHTELSRLLNSTDNKKNTQQAETITVNNYNPSCNTNETHKIFILADDQGRNLQQTLQQLIGIKYSVSCVWKPGAKLCDVINTYENEIKSLTNKDYIIVLGGINDSNPTALLQILSNWLQVNKKVNIIISEVPRNEYLNERKLNYEVKFLCSLNKNTCYVDMNYSRYTPHKRYTSLYIGRMLLKEILHIEYKNRYNDYINENLRTKKPLMTDKSTQTESTQCDAETTTSITQENIDVNNTDSNQGGNIETTEQLFRV